MTRHIFIVLCFFLLTSLPALKAQDSVLTLPYTDINTLLLSKEIKKDIAFTYMKPHVSLEKEYGSLNFSRGPVHKGLIPDKYVTQKAVLRFNICNSGDTSRSVYFFPGLYYYHIDLYRLQQNKLVKIAPVLPASVNETSYRLFSVAPGDSVTIVADLEFVKTYLNAVNPTLITPVYLNSYIDDLHNRSKDTQIFTFLFCGLLLMMILFSFSNYLQGANPEFLFYSGYAFLIGVMLFLKAVFSRNTSFISFFQEGYFDFIMLGFGFILYLLFMKKFLSTKKQHPFLEKLYTGGIIMLIAAMLVYSYAHYFTDNYPLENKTEVVAKLLLLVMVIIFLIYSIRYWKEPLFRYLFWGNVSLLIFSICSFLILTASFIPKGVPGIFKASLFYYEMGLFLELLFFLMGLSYKNRRQIIKRTRETERLKAANQFNEYEKEIAVYKAQQQERERISADMHDELGSGMTAIRLMSEIARNKMKESTPVEIDKISHSADEVLNKMNAIIWSMNSGNDTVDNLVSYIRSYSIEYFENTPINCKVFTPDIIDDKEMSGDKRRNLFLCVKETLNNALKHSKATEIKIYFKIDDNMTIKIIDNGAGIDLQNIRRFGNGLKNISKRMESIGGSYQIENNKGTVTTLRLPL